MHAADAAPVKISPAVAQQNDVGGQFLPDAVVVTEKLHPTANLSYKVAGKRYYPTKEVIENFSQTGRASWYGPGFHGKKTSNGERFDMNMMTAAHPTLPIPSYVRVTNLSNGKTVVVRINDRGPFHGNRAIDLSKAAANKLGFLAKGTAQVRIEPVKPNEANAQLAQKDGNTTDAKAIYVNLQKFASKQEAQNFVKSIATHLDKHDGQYRAIVVKQRQDYWVRVGPFKEQQHADEAQAVFKQEVI